ARGWCDLSIQRHAGFKSDQWTARKDVTREGFIQPARLRLHQAHFNLDSLGSQLFKPFSRDQWIRIDHGGNHSPYAGRNHRIGARTSAPLMTARFQIQVESRSTSFCSRLFQRQHFTVLNAEICMKAAAHGLAGCIHHNSSHARVWRSQGCSLLGKLQGLPHVLLVLGTPCHAANNESAKFSALNGSRSPAFSPTPTYRTGRPSSREIATTTPPLAVPSSLVSTIPVTPADSVNNRACCSPFCPVVASITRRTSWGAPGITFCAVRFIFSSSAIKLVLVCSRPAVSTITLSVRRALAAFSASKRTAEGSPPGLVLITSTPVRDPQISSCSIAAARKVSAAHSSTVFPSLRSACASLPIVVVLPVPFTPTTITTSGSPLSG